jgi:hypothetical protein
MEIKAVETIILPGRMLTTREPDKPNVSIIVCKRLKVKILANGVLEIEIDRNDRRWTEYHRVWEKVECAKKKAGPQVRFE